MVETVPIQRLVEAENEFCAEKFVKDLLDEGSKQACDDSQNAFSTQNSVPDYYDEGLYKRGQRFYHQNIFAMFLGKLNGLLAVLAIPSTLKILQHTQMSSSEMTSYRRYMATIFHMIIWYDDDFKPGSRLWQSVVEVRRLHNSASKKSCLAGLHRISQKDMALTQFGFMGFALVRSRMLGIHSGRDEDWKGLVHLWRVIGYVMGVEERYNICRESLKETREICELLLEKVFRPEIEKKDKDFLEMSSYMVNGLWCMSPFLLYKSFVCYLYCLVMNSGREVQTYFEMNSVERARFNLIFVVVDALKWRVVRWYLNFLMLLTFFLMKYFPFLAYYKFGRKDAHVSIPLKKSLKQS